MEVEDSTGFRSVLSGLTHSLFQAGDCGPSVNGWLPKPGLDPAQLTSFIPASILLNALTSVRFAYRSEQKGDHEDRCSPVAKTELPSRSRWITRPLLVRSLDVPSVLS